MALLVDSLGSPSEFVNSGGSASLSSLGISLLMWLSWMKRL